MKHLKLQNEHYKLFVKNYREWLDILGYAESTVYYLPTHLQEFFYWLEENKIENINQITVKTVKDYYRYLQERINERTSGGLSKSYLNKHQQAIKKFSKYLQEHNHKGLNIHLKLEQNTTQEKLNILTQAEIKALFRATTQSHHSQRVQLRDKAMLVVLYSCGLRRNEAVHLDLGDIYFDMERIFVRKGKNYKERFVPINRKNAEILEDYIYEARPAFNNKNNTEALFLNPRGTRLGGMSFSNRLKAIVKAANNTAITDKKITPHTLRHCIATHLLQQEVKLESIKTFLGHASLESTQIYTHILKTINDE